MNTPSTTEKLEVANLFVFGRVDTVVERAGIFFAYVGRNKVYAELGWGQMLKASPGGIVYDETKKPELPKVGELVAIILRDDPRGYQAASWTPFENLNEASFVSVNMTLKKCDHVKIERAPKLAQQMSKDTHRRESRSGKHFVSRNVDTKPEVIDCMRAVSSLDELTQVTNASVSIEASAVPAAATEAKP